jgi:hypothetical protein
VRLTTPIPIVGDVVLSIYVKESHVKLYKKGDEPGSDDLWNGHINALLPEYDGGPIDRTVLIAAVKAKLRGIVMAYLD